MCAARAARQSCLITCTCKVLSVCILCTYVGACTCARTVLGVCSLSGASSVRECMYLFMYCARRVQPERCVQCM